MARDIKEFIGFYNDLIKRKLIINWIILEMNMGNV